MEIQKINFKGLTLVEVMLALGIMAIGIFAGVELMARIVKSDGELRASSGWEDRMMKARAEINETEAEKLETQMAGGREYVLKTVENVGVVARVDTNLPYPATSLPLILRIKDVTGEMIAELPMIKVREVK